MCQNAKEEPYTEGENFIPYANGVEIKRDDITGGFGIFAARDIKPGEMIMVDKTLHFCCDQGKLHDKEATIGPYPNRYNEAMMCAGLQNLSGKKAHLMQYCCDSKASEFETPPITMFTDYRNREHSEHYCQLSPSQILEIVKTKCFGTEIFKHGIYAQ